MKKSIKRYFIKVRSGNRLKSAKEYSTPKQKVRETPAGTDSGAEAGGGTAIMAWTPETSPTPAVAPTLKLPRATAKASARHLSIGAGIGPGIGADTSVDDAAAVSVVGINAGTGTEHNASIGSATFTSVDARTDH